MATVDVVSPQSVPSDKTEFRNYVASEFQDRVSQFYHQNHVNQTLDFVLKQKERFLKLDKFEMSVWEAVGMLNEIIDQSDPDTNDPQIVHLLQTAEAIRRAWPSEEYDWFWLTGFIHDLGKVLSHPKCFNEPQWAVVGDTFPVGCKFDETNVFYDYFQQNPDWKNPLYQSKCGIYKEAIGLDKVHFSWGHDEYLYQVCVQNQCKLPLEALYIIRYHSFYPWHNKGSYNHLTNETDNKMLVWVKEFQKFDLYSKLPEKPDVEKLIPFYQKLIAKYFPKTLKW